MVATPLVVYRLKYMYLSRTRRDWVGRKSPLQSGMGRVTLPRCPYNHSGFSAFTTALGVLPVPFTIIYGLPYIGLAWAGQYVKLWPPAGPRVKCVKVRLTFDTLTQCQSVKVSKFRTRRGPSGAGAERSGGRGVGI